MEEELDILYSGGGGRSKFPDVVGCICGCVIVVLLVDKIEGSWVKCCSSCSVTSLIGTIMADESTV